MNKEELLEKMKKYNEAEDLGIYIFEIQEMIAKAIFKDLEAYFEAGGSDLTELKKKWTGD